MIQKRQMTNLLLVQGIMNTNIFFVKLIRVFIICSEVGFSRFFDIRKLDFFLTIRGFKFIVYTLSN